jgi:hypothetical protein
MRACTRFRRSPCLTVATHSFSMQWGKLCGPRGSSIRATRSSPALPMGLSPAGSSPLRALPENRAGACSDSSEIEGQLPKAQLSNARLGAGKARALIFGLQRGRPQFGFDIDPRFGPHPSCSRSALLIVHRVRNASQFRQDTVFSYSLVFNRYQASGQPPKDLLELRIGGKRFQLRIIGKRPGMFQSAPRRFFERLQCLFPSP